MASIDDLDVDLTPSVDDPQVDDQQQENDNDVVSQVLKDKGIEDPSRIKMANDDGSVSEVNFNDLSKDEQREILGSNPQEIVQDNSDNDDDDDLDDAEVDLINKIRQSGLSPAEYAAAIHRQGANDYASVVAQQMQPHYTVDDLTDEELYVLDMQARVDGITEDELATALDRATSNPELFAKEIAGIRNEYKRLEDDKNRQDAALEAQQQQEMYRQFSSNIANSIQDFTNIGELDVDMSGDDMEELYTFITGHDNAGINYFSKALNDPETLVRMAWFALRGEDVINSISDYYKQQITAAHRAGYEEGASRGRGRSSSSNSKVVVKPRAQKKEKALTIDDIDV